MACEEAGGARKRVHVVGAPEKARPWYMSPFPPDCAGADLRPWVRGMELSEETEGDR